MRKFSGDTLLIATHNEGKVAEIAQMLSEHVANVISAASLNLPEPEETGSTFAENAILKAQAAALKSGKISLADDSGLAVNALNGDPGIYSARWGGPKKDFKLAMQKVQDALGNNADRSAYFVCVLALAWPDGHTETFEGRVTGTLIWSMRGTNGFGYDPMFVPDGHQKTFAEMNMQEKKSISHRRRAFDQLISGCFGP